MVHKYAENHFSIPNPVQVYIYESYIRELKGITYTTKIPEPTRSIENSRGRKKKNIVRRIGVLRNFA